MIELFKRVTWSQFQSDTSGQYDDCKVLYITDKDIHRIKYGEGDNSKYVMYSEAYGRCDFSYEQALSIQNELSPGIYILNDDIAYYYTGAKWMRLGTAGGGGTGSGLELGETPGTAYEGSKGKANADAIESLKTGKQDTLVAGANITIEGGVISGTVNEEDILNKILDPDNNPLAEDEPIEDPEIDLEIGKLDRNGDGKPKVDAGGLRTPDFIDIRSCITITPEYEIANADSIRILFYDSNQIYLGKDAQAVVPKGETLKISNVTSGAAFIKCYISYENAADNPNEGKLILHFTREDNATKAEHKKVYLADHGYSIYGDQIDDKTMHKVVICAEGRDANEYNITEIKAPSNDAKEATLCLMNSGKIIIDKKTGETQDVVQFVDFSSMIYKNKPEVAIVCQTRRGRPLPKFAIQFNDGTSETDKVGRVSKFTVRPDAVPIQLTADGIKVRKSNDPVEDEDDTDDNYETVSLIDFSERITTLETTIDGGTWT
jgi:hypothetical protein